MDVSGDTIGYFSVKYSQLRKMYFSDIVQAMEKHTGRIVGVLSRRLLPVKIQGFSKQVSSPMVLAQGDEQFKTPNNPKPNMPQKKATVDRFEL